MDYKEVQSIMLQIFCKKNADLLFTITISKANFQPISYFNNEIYIYVYFNLKILLLELISEKETVSC